jgi:diguanylate cyclase (GGDEF)-like protein
MVSTKPLTLIKTEPMVDVGGGRFGVPDIGLATSVINLLPIPAALIVQPDSGLALLTCNVQFQHAGLGQAGEESPFVIQAGGQLAAFLDSESLKQEFSWQFGEAVDCRHYRVTLARIARGDVRRCLVTLVDQTAELRTEHNLRREMLTDSLTGLPNRAGFSDQLETMLASPQERGGYAIMVLDLDRFSRVNACLGSMVGDELLITVARRLKGAIRGHDILARTGGDEFGILLRLEQGASDAELVATRIEGALATPFRLTGFEIMVSCSIGIAYGSSDVDDAEELIRHAQFTVKRSKVSGRAESYQMQAFDIAREQFGMETALRRAIENGELRLTYQPICDLATGKVVAFESLARWTDGDGRAHSPDTFIPVAEESGLIVPLGRWAIDEAARTLASWDTRAGGDCGAKVAVNLSAIQLQRDSIPFLVERALTANGLEGRRLSLELTESALVTDPDRIAGVMQALKALGTTIAMDDFGTGYSNLTGMLADRDKIAIVRAILSLAQALGMMTTAEGIETRELSQTLAALGCTYGQGYVYARPLEAEAAYAFLAASH